jgi:hypothetical protein
MTTESTSADDATRRDGSALSEGLGPLSPMEQLLAFCDWERKHNPHPHGKLHVAAWAAAEIERLAAENKTLREAAEYAAHKLEGARIWNGTDWHYNPLHPLHYRSALERLRDVLRA